MRDIGSVVSQLVAVDTRVQLQRLAAEVVGSQRAAVKACRPRAERGGVLRVGERLAVEAEVRGQAIEQRRRQRDRLDVVDLRQVRHRHVIAHQRVVELVQARGHVEGLVGELPHLRSQRGDLHAVAQHAGDAEGFGRVLPAQRDGVVVLADAGADGSHACVGGGQRRTVQPRGGRVKRHAGMGQQGGDDVGFGRQRGQVRRGVRRCCARFGQRAVERLVGGEEGGAVLHRRHRGGGAGGIQAVAGGDHHQPVFGRLPLVARGDGAEQLAQRLVDAGQGRGIGAVAEAAGFRRLCRRAVLRKHHAIAGLHLPHGVLRDAAVDPGAVNQRIEHARFLLGLEQARQHPRTGGCALLQAGFAGRAQVAEYGGGLQCGAAGIVFDAVAVGPGAGQHRGPAGRVQRRLRGDGAGHAPGSGGHQVQLGQVGQLTPQECALHLGIGGTVHAHQQHARAAGTGWRRGLDGGVVRCGCRRGVIAAAAARQCCCQCGDHGAGQHTAARHPRQAARCKVPCHL